jgi:hypothetical protein
VSESVDQLISPLQGGGGLFTYDVAKDEYIPYMAESFTASADKRTFTLTSATG